MTVHVDRPRAALLALLIASVALGITTPAAAHEGDGILTVESQAPAGDLAVRYVVRLTWADDGHPALGATVTAVPVAPDGEPQTPVTLEPTDEDGRYSATVTYPTAGDWTVRITSVTPTDSIEITEAVRSQPTSTTRPLTTTTTTAVGPGDDPSSNAATDGDPGTEDDGSPIGGALALGGLVALVTAAVVGVARSARRSREHR